MYDVYMCVCVWGGLPIGFFPAAGRGSNLYAGDGAAPAPMTETTWDPVMHSRGVDGAAVSADADRSGVPGAGESIFPAPSRIPIHFARLA